MTDLAVAHDDLRPLMFSIAYRMLGSVAEAEDVVQEAFLRMHKATEAGTAIETLDAYATTVTTRVAIDALRTARKRRETYLGSWLPEPLLDDDADPAHRIEIDETLSTAFLVVLEQLSAVERAVFILREVFGYEYAEIADVVEKSEANCRQLLVRAKRHLDANKPRFASDRRQREVIDQFLAAAQNGDLAALERALVDDIRFYGDGGGKAPAVRRPIEGALAVARFMLGLVQRGQALGVRLEQVSANGRPALLLRAPGGELVGVLSIDVGEAGVTELRNQINPDKLRHLGPVGDLWAMMSPGEDPPGP